MVPNKLNGSELGTGSARGKLLIISSVWTSLEVLVSMFFSKFFFKLLFVDFTHVNKVFSGL
jgi:hypothetical protein